jgi:hypothetical protein
MNYDPNEASIESDELRRRRRGKLQRLDRILFSIVAAVTLAVAASIVWLMSPTPALTLDQLGYDLSKLSVDRELIVSPWRNRRTVPPLDNPKTVTVDEVALLNEQGRGKFLVGGDRVIGVTINGESRAYPLRLLNWHEVCNDVLGGQAIAVTYSPLCDSAVVFSRVVNGEAVRFVHSGLLYNSNLLLRELGRDAGKANLWSQLRFDAIAGPRVGEKLTPLPMSLSRWEDWRAAHPDTTVIRGSETYKKQYKRSPYGPYFVTGKVQFPVEPKTTIEVDGTERADMRRMLARQTESGWRTTLLEEGASLEADVTLTMTGEAPTFLATGNPTATVYACNFAWQAMHGPAIEE